jgi:tRNA pseudouridine38-40 synthase
MFVKQIISKQRRAGNKEPPAADKRQPAADRGKQPLKEQKNMPQPEKSGKSASFKYKLTVEYDGTGYSGWQVQKNARSIQGAILDSARELFGKEVDIQGAGRTDAGVHALAQVAHMEVPARLPLSPRKMLLEWNERLPASINIVRLEEAPTDFHARHSAQARSYIYVISRRRTAFGKRYVWYVKDDLNVEMMKRALETFNGFHDFSSFADKRIDKNLSTEVAIESTELGAWGDLIVFRIVGSHFLWKMVRRIAGILVEAGRGNLSPAAVQQLLNSHSEFPAHYTSPPSGLFLEKVIYKGEALAPLMPPALLPGGVL